MQKKGRLLVPTICFNCNFFTYKLFHCPKCRILFVARTRSGWPAALQWPSPMRVNPGPSSTNQSSTSTEKRSDVPGSLAPPIPVILTSRFVLLTNLGHPYIKVRSFDQSGSSLHQGWFFRPIPVILISRLEFLTNPGHPYIKVRTSDQSRSSFHQGWFFRPIRVVLTSRVVLSTNPCHPYIKVRSFD